MLVRTLTRQLATTFALGLAATAHAAEVTMPLTSVAVHGSVSILEQVGAALGAFVHLASLTVPTALEPPSIPNPAPLPPIEPSLPLLPTTAYASRGSGLPAQTIQKATRVVERSRDASARV
jgi:hypothetical protein